MTSKFRLMALAVFLLVWFTGCGMQEGLKKSDAAVIKFHSQLNAAAFDQIYTDSGDALKENTTQKKFVDLLTAVHRKLGAVKSANRTNFFVNYAASGSTVRVNYSTQFDVDSATEEFIFRINADELRLTGYHINSDALITQ
jgi:hypothetical protein